ncbi:hypothetical protein KEM52_000747 [Ascosphaera acerosa]|nr:hypothetical protein KEM52_000747 [Ascosphaera acerosa]
MSTPCPPPPLSSSMLKSDIGRLVLQTIVWMQLNIELGISYQHLNWSVAVQSVGLSVGCLMFIPFTKKYGRRSSYILSMAVLAGMYWWTARMQTTAELYVTNLIVGLASAMNETLAQMTIADIFFIHQRGRANAWYMTAVSIGNLLPIAGGAQAEAEGWRATYYTAAGCFTGVTVIALFLFEETKYIPIVSGVSDPDDTTASPSGDLDKGPKAIAMQEVDDMPDPELQKPHLAAPPAMNSWRQRLRWTTTTDDSLWQHFMAPFATSGLPAVMWASLQYASVVAWITVIASLAAQFFPAPPYNFGSLALGAMSVPARHLLRVWYASQEELARAASQCTW